MRKQKQDRQRQADLLARAPASATRVLVITVLGKKKYKEPDKLADTDVIQTNKAGDPIVMKRKPGRTSVVDVGPANAVIAEVIRQKEAAIKADAILNTVEVAPESPDVLHEVIKGLSEEAASLRFARDHAAREGKDTSQFSSKRVIALRAVGDVWLKRMEQLSDRAIDLDSPAFEALFRHTMTTLREAMNAANLRDEQVEMVFAKVAERVGTEEWRNEAKIRMKKARS